MVRQIGRPKNAFTLVEVMMVLVILIVVAALAYPSLEAMQDQFSVDASADQIKGRFAECRAHAIEEGIAYRFAVHPDSSEFKIAPDTTDHWDDSTGVVGVIDPDAHPLVIQDSIEKNVLFRIADNGGAQATGTPTASNPSGTVPNAAAAPGSSSGGWTTVVVFQPDGTCSNDGEIRFAIPGTKPVVIKIRALTGIIQTQRDNNP